MTIDLRTVWSERKSNTGINTFWDLLQSVKARKYCVEHWTGYLTALTGRFERPIYLINSVNKYKFACLYSVHYLKF